MLPVEAQRDILRQTRKVRGKSAAKRWGVEVAKIAGVAVVVDLLIRTVLH